MVLLLVPLDSIAYRGRQEVMGGIPNYIGMIGNFGGFLESLIIHFWNADLCVNFGGSSRTAFLYCGETLSS